MSSDRYRTQDFDVSARWSTETRTSFDTEQDAAAPANALASAFHRLDQRLRQAIVAIDSAQAEESEPHPYRGLCISSVDAVRSLNREAGAPRLRGAESSEPGVDPVALLGHFEPSTRFAKIGRVFGLTPFDLGIVLIALAPEFDLKYERIYAYLQDDVSRRRPSVDLVLNLLCRSAVEKLARRAHFAPDAPLVLSRLLRLSSEQPLQPPLLSCLIRLDEQIVRFLLLQRRTRPPVVAGLSAHPPRAGGGRAGLVAPGACKAVAGRLDREGAGGAAAVTAVFPGRPGSGQASVAATLAAEAGAALLSVDLSRWPSLVGPDIDDAVRVLMREALFQGALLYLEPWDALYDAPGGQSPLRDVLPAQLADFTGVAILSGERPWEPQPRGPHGVVSVRFDIPPFDVRRACWEAQAAAAQIPLADKDLDALAGLYRLNPEQIADAVATVAASHPVNHFADSPAEPTPPSFAPPGPSRGTTWPVWRGGLSRSTAGTTWRSPPTPSCSSASSASRSGTSGRCGRSGASAARSRRMGVPAPCSAAPPARARRPPPRSSPRRCIWTSTRSTCRAS